MYTHEPHVSDILSISADGRRGAATSAVVQTQPDVPSYYEQDLATNAVLEAADFSYAMGDTSFPVEEQDPGPITPVAKKKRYENSVC
jgi:hypothetical protein